MQKQCDGSNQTLRWFKWSIAMFFCLFIICQKNGLTCYRVTFLVNFWCITEILCNFAA